jgi:integrase
MRSVKLNKLTQLDVKSAGPNAILSDGGGLYLRNRLWVFRYTSPVTGRERDLSFGSRDALPLKSARAEAQKCRELIAIGIDPREARDAKREEDKTAAAKKRTFGEVAQLWMKAKLPDRKSEKNQRAIRSSIESHMKPLASIPIALITSAMIADAVKPLKDRPAQQNNLVSIVHSIFDWAYAADILPEGLNPARRKKLGKLLPKRDLVARPIRHNRFGEVEDLPAFIAKLSAVPGNLARALEFTIHTGLRQNEVVNLRWAWVDHLDDRSVTIPGAFMKAKKDHTVYLADRPFEIIMSMLPQRREGGLVFPGGSALGGVGLRSLRTFIADRFPDVGQVQIHGCRAAFKSWATANDKNRMIAEMALAHRVGDAVEAAYLNVNDLRKAREALYHDWSAFLTAAASTETVPNVVPFKTTAMV